MGKAPHDARSRQPTRDENDPLLNEAVGKALTFYLEQADGGLFASLRIGISRST